MPFCHLLLGSSSSDAVLLISIFIMVILYLKAFSSKIKYLMTTDNKQCEHVCVDILANSARLYVHIRHCYCSISSPLLLGSRIPGPHGSVQYIPANIYRNYVFINSDMYVVQRIFFLFRRNYNYPLKYNIKNKRCLMITFIFSFDLSFTRLYKHAYVYQYMLYNTQI